MNDMLASLPFHWRGATGNDSGQFRRRRNRPRPDNGSGDSPRPPFFSEFVNQIGNLFFTELIYHLFGGHTLPRIHPHIKVSVRLKTESSVRLVELHRAHSDVGEHSIQAVFTEHLMCS